MNLKLYTNRLSVITRPTVDKLSINMSTGGDAHQNLKKKGPQSNSPTYHQRYASRRHQLLSNPSSGNSIARTWHSSSLSQKSVATFPLQCNTNTPPAFNTWVRGVFLHLRMTSCPQRFHAAHLNLFPKVLVASRMQDFKDGARGPIGGGLGAG